MRGGAFLLAPLLFATPAAAEAPMAWPDGLYSNVDLVEETGDYVGMEARFFRQDGRRMVEFVWCEGWCNQVHVLPVTRYDNGFEFHFTQRFADGGSDASVDMHFVAWPTGRGLKISAWQGRESLDAEGKPQVLRRARKPFGIGIARSSGAD